ncbi:hypothetical protein [Streptosporangium sandarakinum]|uniref:hypothetical protein n=1 Tax=Streptosporangium sandarakinum TaxID=1260955 RepID=UPI00341C12CB
MSAKPPSRVTIGTVLSVVGALFIGYVGVGYLPAPRSMAPDFGLPTWPHGEGAGFLAVKGSGMWCPAICGRVTVPVRWSLRTGT